VDLSRFVVGEGACLEVGVGSPRRPRTYRTNVSTQSSGLSVWAAFSFTCLAFMTLWNNLWNFFIPFILSSQKCFYS